MHVTLRALRYTVTTADCQSITEASRQLNISQPSISAAISQIEEQCGFLIFVRHHARGVSTTPAGQKFVAEARLLLKHSEDFERTAMSLSADSLGEVTIGCFSTLAARILPSLYVGFRQKHPRIDIKIREGNQEQILNRLISGHTEFALTYAYAVPDEIDSMPLARLPPYVLLPANHRFADASEVELQDLAEDNFLLLDLPHTRDYFTSLFSSAGIMPRIGMRVQSFEVLRAMVSRGVGCALHNAISRSSFSTDDSPIRTVRVSGNPAPVHIVGLTLKQPQRPVVGALTNYLKEAFGPGGSMTRDLMLDRPDNALAPR